MQKAQIILAAVEEAHYRGWKGKHALDVVAMTQVSLTPTGAKRWLPLHRHHHEPIDFFMQFTLEMRFFWAGVGVVGGLGGVWHRMIIPNIDCET